VYNLIGRMEPEFTDDGLTPTPARRFVKARLDGSGTILMCNHDGFAVSYSTLTEHEARALLGVPTPPPLAAKKSSTVLVCAPDDLAEQNMSDAEFEEELVKLAVALFTSMDVNDDGGLDMFELQSRFVVRRGVRTRCRRRHELTLLRVHAGHHLPPARLQRHLHRPNHGRPAQQCTLQARHLACG
jgi:hypothetical protein